MLCKRRMPACRLFYLPCPAHTNSHKSFLAASLDGEGHAVRDVSQSTERLEQRRRIFI